MRTFIITTGLALGLVLSSKAQFKVSSSYSKTETVNGQVVDHESGSFGIGGGSTSSSSSIGVGRSSQNINKTIIDNRSNRSDEKIAHSENYAENLRALSEYRKEKIQIKKAKREERQKQLEAKLKEAQLKESLKVDKETKKLKEQEIDLTKDVNNLIIRRAKRQGELNKTLDNNKSTYLEREKAMASFSKSDLVVRKKKMKLLRVQQDIARTVWNEEETQFITEEQTSIEEDGIEYSNRKKLIKGLKKRDKLNEDVAKNKEIIKSEDSPKKIVKAEEKIVDLNSDIEENEAEIKALEELLNTVD